MFGWKYQGRFILKLRNIAERSRLPAAFAIRKVPARCRRFEKCGDERRRNTFNFLLRWAVGSGTKKPDRQLPMRCSVAIKASALELYVFLLAASAGLPKWAKVRPISALFASSSTRSHGPRGNALPTLPRRSAGTG